jgi:citrate lyase subunit beta/citryl-CoA lyase
MAGRASRPAQRARPSESASTWFEDTVNMRLPITYLFVPGNRPERFDKALAAGADAVILDLEDAVSPHDKDAARAHVAAWITAHPQARERVVIRINDGSTSWFAADIEMLRRAGVRMAMLSKAETPQQVVAVGDALPPDGRVLPLIETARGVQSVEAVAATSRVQRLVFGTLDYGVDLDLAGDDRGLVYPSSRIAIASRCAGIASPVAGVTAAIDDDQRLLADLAFARAFGFGAKLCIHPKQVAAVHAALQPGAAELDWARRVITAAEGAQGAVQVDGRMVDKPVLQRAHILLQRAAH